jgi:hypothetical protein
VKDTKRATSWSAMAMIATVVSAAGSALAYIDAGSGSYIFQLIVGAMVGTAVAAKMFWRRVFSFFTGRLSRKT